MFYDNGSGLLRVLVVGTLAYVWLILVLRITGKRSLAQLNAFDSIVTVALGSALATVILSNTVAWAEGALGLALLAVLQLVVAWLSVRVPALRHAVTASPTLLLRDGQPPAGRCELAIWRPSAGRVALRTRSTNPGLQLRDSPGAADHQGPPT